MDIQLEFYFRDSQILNKSVLCDILHAKIT